MEKGPAVKQRASARSEVQRQSILDAASLLFIDKGFGGTNLNDIADALGVSRTALYYYFPSKESILEALTEDVTQAAGRLAKTVSARNELPPDAALRQLVLQHAQLILSHALQFRVVERSENNLPEDKRAAAQSARHSVLAQFVAVIQRGVDSGHFRVPSARIAALSIIGMCNWSAWWFKPGGDASADEVAQSLAELALRAVEREKSRRPRAATAAESIQMLREDLALLEAQLKGAKPG